LGVGLTTPPCKKKIIEKPPRNSAGFCGGGIGLSWDVEPRKEERRRNHYCSVRRINTGSSAHHCSQLK
jgi:hypothetical protein